MKALIHEIRELIRSARQAVVKSVDLIQVLTNFEIGRRIVEHEQQGATRAGYGEGTLNEIASALTEEFGRGFSPTNLKMMRKFYSTYQNRISQTASDFLLTSQKGQTLSDLLHMAETASQKIAPAAKTQIPSALFTLRAHYVFLMGIKSEGERCFYEIEAASQHWSLRELKRQFDSGLYNRIYAVKIGRDWMVVQASLELAASRKPGRPPHSALHKDQKKTKCRRCGRYNPYW